MIKVILQQQEVSRIQKALRRVARAFTDLDSLVEGIAEEYARAVHRNIMNQNLPNYPVRTTAYMNRKRREGRPLGHWRYLDRAVEGIGLRKGEEPNSYVVWSWDVPHAKYMEKGGGNPTPVPVFKFTLDTYEPLAITRIKKWLGKVEAMYI